MKKLASILITFSLAMMPMLAQTSTGSITGSVTDESGAVIPGATITATRTATGETRTVVSEDNGFYRVLNISPGVYTVRCEMPGFKTIVDENVEVTVGEIKTINFAMNIGEVSEEIIVSSVAETVNKEEGRLSQLVESAEIEDLPLNGRNAYQLAQLGPGVTPTFGRVSQSAGSNAGDSFQVNGQRHRANNYLLDGTDNNYVGIAGTPTITPQVDIIEEFRVATNSFSAEYGRNAGAIVNVLTKSGTNQLHGTLYHYHRNDALDAREFFDGEDPAPLIQNTFGFTIGGPIVKDKWFFFGGYEGFREVSGESEQFDVETQQLVDWTMANRPGSIAATLFSRFPLNSPLPTTGDDLGSPAPGVLEIGDPDGIPDLGEINIADPAKTESDQWNVRIDYSMSDNDKFYGRFTRQVTETPPNIIRPGVDSIGNVTEQAFTFSQTHVFSPVVVNEFRAGWNEREPNFNVQDGTFDVPTIRVDDVSAEAGFGANSNIPQFFARHTFQFADQLAWSLNRHSLKFGFEFRHGQENSDFQANTRGNYGFDSILDFVDDESDNQTNLIDPVTFEPIGTPRHFRVNEWAFYIQDDWKVSPNFTLNLGLRYENFRPPYETDGIQSNVLLGPGDDIFERYATADFQVIARGDHVYDPDNNNFAPRLGFAWDPFGDGKLAIRGGYGVSYNRIFMNITSNIKFNAPFSKSVTASVDNGLPIVYTIPTTIDPETAGGATARVNPNFLDPDLATSYVHSIFFGLQREILPGWIAEANYVSTMGRKLYAQEHYNRFAGDLVDGTLDTFNPAFSQNDDFLTGSINQAYHSGQFSLAKRFRDGLGFRVNYTWSKNIDSDSDVFGATSDDSGAMDAANRNLDRGLSSIHVGNRFAANWVWEIPVYRTADNWFLRNVIGGWQLNGLIALQDGTPASINADGSTFTSTIGGVRRGDFNADGHSSDRPDDPGFGSDDVTPSDARFGSIFAGFVNGDPRLAFPRPEAGVNGTLGRNTFFYPGFASVDLSLFKSFKMPWFGSETATWQFRAEFFNLLNNVNVNAWQEDIASSSFGESTSTQDAREIQFAIKLVF